MSDLIDRQAAIDAVTSLCDDCDSDYCGSCRVDYPGEKNCRKVLENLPSAQPERKKGRWLNINESEKWECSECGRMMWFSPRLGVKPSDYRFCPNCGADMTDKEGAQNDRQNNIPVTDMD